MHTISVIYKAKSVDPKSKVLLDKNNAIANTKKIPVAIMIAGFEMIFSVWYGFNSLLKAFGIKNNNKIPEGNHVTSFEMFFRVLIRIELVKHFKTMVCVIALEL